MTSFRRGTLTASALSTSRAACSIAAVVLVGSATAAECGAAARIPPQALQQRPAHGRLQILYSFRGGEDGALPAAAVLVDKTGALYGTTQAGGGEKQGTVFKLTPSGSGYVENVLYPFKGVKHGKHDGALPLAGLIEDEAGSLYGTTAGGGFSDLKSICSSNRITGCGTVFKLTPSSGRYTESILYRFRGVPTDGISPFAGLTADSAGGLYGTTYEGGDVLYPGGTVFKLTPLDKKASYTEAVLFTFPSGSRYADGLFPSAVLLADDSGAFYGTAELGGACPGEPVYGCGVAFKLTPSESGYTQSVLYAFQGGSDGFWPVAGLIADGSGALYGTTQYGGSANLGTVFKLTPSTSGYTESNLYAFDGIDGALPVAGLISDKSGALYGTTSAGGAANQGTIFKLTPSGSGYTETVLHAFRGAPNDGSEPVAGLVSGKSGIYGTTLTGGASGVGTVFALTQ